MCITLFLVSRAKGYSLQGRNTKSQTHCIVTASLPVWEFLVCSLNKVFVAAFVCQTLCLFPSVWAHMNALHCRLRNLRTGRMGETWHFFCGVLTLWRLPQPFGDGRCPLNRWHYYITLSVLSKVERNWHQHFETWGRKRGVFNAIACPMKCKNH